MAFSPDDQKLAVNTLFLGKDVELWDWRRAVVAKRFPYEGAPGDGKGLAYSKDGRFIAAIHSEPATRDVIRIWDAHSGKPLADIPEGIANSGPITFVGDRSVFIRVGSIGRTTPGDQITAYDSSSWRKIWGARLDNLAPDYLSTTGDGSKALLEGMTYTSVPGQLTPKKRVDIYEVDLSNGHVVKILKGIFGTRDSIETFVVSPNGAQFAVGRFVTANPENLYAVAIYDAATGRALFTLAGAEGQDTKGMAYTPDGRYLIVAAVDNKARVIDLQQRRVVQTISVNAQVVTVSSDSQYVALASDDNVSVWQINKP
jgi:WD40 repeat protein